MGLENYFEGHGNMGAGSENTIKGNSNKVVGERNIGLGH